MSEKPKRLQLSRKAGHRLPPGAVSVARPSKWGNPFRVGEINPVTRDRPVKSRAEAVGWYSLHTGPMGNYELDVAEVRRVLGGKDLACWCPLPADGEPDVCHAAVLLEIANSHD
jgi:hypothetical protein